MKTKKSIIKIIGSILFIIIGAIVGVIGGIIIGKSNIFGKTTFIDVVIIIGIFIASFIIQIIIHEAGHLIFGLLSGYEFISFRIFSFTIVKENGRLVRKKFNIQGTGGQCLMMPKEDDIKRCPYVLYNLGGVLMNLIISSLGIIILMSIPLPKFLKIFLISIIASGIIIFITNGIPMKVSGLSNDGYNILSISRDDFIKRCFYIQLKVNGLIYKGIRVKDMPFEWFKIEENADLNNSIITSIKILEANYYHDKLEFEKAKECYESLLNDAKNILEIYKYEIQCELLFYEIIGEKRDDVINKLYTKELKRYIKATDCYISRKRLMYAYSLLIERDLNKADEILKEIDVVKNTYPAKGEIKSELEIIRFLQK